ncbi:MAG TPA: phosphatase PAP2 family protein [Xylella sp.]
MNSILSMCINQSELIQDRKFLLFHLWLPLGVTLLLSGLLMGLEGDLLLADLLYHLEGGQWLLKQHWATEYLIHRAGKWLTIVAVLCLLAGTLVRCWGRLGMCDCWRPVLYVVMTVALSTSLISMAKRFTGMDCPWDLVRYGGRLPFVGLFESRHGLEASGCFPAGHASAGYAWVCLYFVALALCPAWRWLGLMIGLVAGLTFGISQQLRGAHFISHDLWSLAICWLVALGFFYLFFVFPAARALSIQQGKIP